MNTSRAHHAALTPDEARRLDALCDRFESAWRSGQHPKLDEYLAQAAAAEASAALSELLAVELAYRRRTGETPRADEYRRRFPALAAAVDSAFAGPDQSTPHSPHSAEASTLPATVPLPEAPGGPSRDEFGMVVLRSGLLTREKLAQRLRELAADARPIGDSAKALARFLIERGDLTRYQAERLLAGRSAGFLLGDYKILDKLGAGGMGKVYLAEQTKLRRQVALKVLPRDRADDPRYLERFQREARAVAALKHPNIVQVYDVGNLGPTHFIVMELARGLNLKELLRQRGPLAPADAAALVEQVATGLAHAHERGIVHRDVKPSNLVLEGATVKVLDLGLARQFEGGESLTGEGQGMGTADYMSPEQCRDAEHSADARSDLYSLGCTWYELVAGGPPFPSGDSVTKALAHVQQEPPPVQGLAPAVTDAMAAMIHKLLRKSPDERYQTCGELLSDLASWRSGSEAPAAADVLRVDVDTTPARGEPTAASTPTLKAADDASSDTLISRPTTSVPMYLAYLLPVMAALVLGGAYFGIDALRKQLAETEPIVVRLPAAAATPAAEGTSKSPPPDSPPAVDETQEAPAAASPRAAVESPGDNVPPSGTTPQDESAAESTAQPAARNTAQPAAKSTAQPAAESTAQPAARNTTPVEDQPTSVPPAPDRAPTVRRVGGGDGGLADLEAAWTAAGDGDTIELAASRPLCAGRLATRGKRLALRAAAGAKTRPIVVFDAAAPSPGSGCWQIEAGTLAVDGIDFYLDVSDAGAPADEIALFELVESDLRLVGTTVTVVRGPVEGRTPVNVIKLLGERPWDPQAKGEPPRPVEVDLRDSMFRGASTAIYVDSRQATVRVENSIICGPGPLVHLYHTRPFEFAHQRLLVELGGSTFDLDGPLVAIDCRPFQLAPVIGLEASVRSSLVACPRQEADAPLVLWQSPVDDELLSTAIRWTGNNNVYVRRGAGLKAKSESGPVVTYVDSPADWQRLGFGVETASNSLTTTAPPMGPWHDRKVTAYDAYAGRSQRAAKNARRQESCGADSKRVANPRKLPR